MMKGGDLLASVWFEKHSYVVVFVGLLISLFILKRIFKGPLLPPGPRRLPVIGNAHQLDMKVMHQSLSHLSKKYGDIMYLRLGPIPLLIISSPVLAEEILKTQDHLFSSRPRNIAAELFGVLVMAPIGDTWRKIRRFVNMELTTTKRIQQSQGRRTGELVKFVRHILEDGEKGPLNMSVKLNELVFNLATQNLFSKSFYGFKTSITGSVTGEGKDFPTLIKETMEKAMFVLGDIYPFLRKLDIGGVEAMLRNLQKELDGLLRQILEEHRNEVGSERSTKEPDFVDVFLSIQSRDEDDSLTEKQMICLLYDLILATTDTISSQAIWIVTDVIRHPEVLQKLQKELDSVVGRNRLVEASDLVHMKYLYAVIKECTRLHPVLPIGAPHVATKATKVAGYDIPMGTRVFVNHWAMGRDPRLWDDPIEFNPDRFWNSPIDMKGQHFQLLPFGSGRRMCPGMNLGIQMIQHMVAQLFHACEFTLPSGIEPQTVDLQEEFAGSLKKKVPLELFVSPRLPSHVYDDPNLFPDNKVAV